MDKSQRILDALELGPHTLPELVESTGLPRPTTHRLAMALAEHGMLDRDRGGRFVLGPRISQLASAVADDRLVALAPAVLLDLRRATGESAQLYRRQGGQRVCVAVADLTSGLRDTVPLGARLSMAAGSAARVLLAWECADIRDRYLANAAFDAKALLGVRERGWAESVAEREPGVASVSAPVRGPSGRVVAAVSVSGPIDRMGTSPGLSRAELVVAAGGELTRRLGE